MSRTLHLFGTDWGAMMVPIQVIRWYRMQCYDGTDSCAIVVPIRRYCHSLANRSGIMAEKKHQLTALGIAYEAVIKLGYTHSKLARLDSSINYPTLRNIRDGKEMKKATERFYLKLFFDLINKEYERRMACGGDGAVSLLIVMKNILEAELK